ncbi:MAG: ABC transporter permease [Oligoflexia bacterium]|nr:ABC transporter permease [Oligoflexia bacterium]
MSFRRIQPARIAAIAVKEWREIVRDRLFFALAFLVPSALMIVVGYGLSLDVENIPLVIVDRDHSALSREYAYRFISARYFRFMGYASSIDELDRPIKSDRIRAVIEIPPDFEKNLIRRNPVQVRSVIDGTFPSRAQITKGYIIAINGAANLDLTAREISSLIGIPEVVAREKLQPIRIEARYLYNENIQSRWSIVPKLIMAILLMSPPFLTVIGVVREKESGSIYNIYSSDVTKSEFLIGKLAPYVGISFCNSIVLFLIATLVFQVAFKGSVPAFFFATAIYVICTTAIGLLVSVLVRTQIAAMIITIIITLLPAVLYSGLLFPISSSTPAARVIAHLLPAMYYTSIVDNIFLKGEGWAAAARGSAILGVYLAVLFFAGYSLFSKRPSR